MVYSNHGLFIERLLNVFSIFDQGKYVNILKIKKHTGAK